MKVAGAAFALLFAPTLASAADLPNPYPDVARSYYVLVNGQPLWGKAIDEPLPPASLTKVMTAVIAARRLDLDQAVTVSAAATRVDGTRMGLHAGDRVTGRDLLRAALVRSANDACVALAEAVSGTEAAFVAAMNREAATAGLTHTHFVNACGLDAPGHLSTVRDLVALGQELMKDPVLAGIVGQTQAAIRVNGKARRLQSTNALMGAFPGTRGIKTGHTERAGKCLLVLVERGDTKVLAAFLDARDRWWDAVAVLELAFRHRNETPAAAR